MPTRYVRRYGKQWPHQRPWQERSETEQRSLLKRVAVYSGNFPFLVEMSQMAQDQGWRPTNEQGNAMLRSFRHPRNQ